MKLTVSKVRLAKRINPKLGNERYSDSRIYCVHRGDHVGAHEWCENR
jgi:hypothetical protein